MNEIPPGLFARIALHRLSCRADFPALQRITERYDRWSQTPQGMLVQLQVSALAAAHIAGPVTRTDYRKSLRKLARDSGLPASDFKLIAKRQLELMRIVMNITRRPRCN